MSLAPLAFLGRDTLLGVGVSLIILGVFMHGFARNIRRAHALQRQHEYHVRKLEPDATSPAPEHRPSHFERHLGRYASAALTLGLLLAVASFFRG